jgi:hypothetical protein
MPAQKLMPYQSTLIQGLATEFQDVMQKYWA